MMRRRMRMRMCVRPSLSTPCWVLATAEAAGFCTIMMLFVMTQQQLLVSAMATTSTAPLKEIPRFASIADYQRRITMDGGAYQSHEFDNVPVIIQGVLSAAECDEICHAIMNPKSMSMKESRSEVADSPPIQVQVQRRRKLPPEPIATAKRRKTSVSSQTKATTTQMVTVSLTAAMDLMLNSHHDDARWCFHEGFFAEFDNVYGATNISARLDAARRAVLEATTVGPQSLLEGIHDSSHHATANANTNLDWFDCFPQWAQPAADCLIVSGTGATSTLHRDPFEWTGTSVAVEGCKLWRFVQPPPAKPAGDGGGGGVEAIDAMLQSYRLPSHAWASSEQEDRVVLSAGWQSDFSLYRTRNDVANPSSRVDTNDDEQYWTDALSLETLKPDDNLKLDGVNLWTTVQRPGDFVVIPAHWWHQTYALEPSVTVSSQWCSHYDIRRVLEHMQAVVDVSEPRVAKDANTLTSIDLNSILGDLSKPQQSVDAFFERFLDAKL